jgi:hypothetical protein
MKREAVQEERAASTKNRQTHMTIGADFYPVPDPHFGLHGGVEKNVISMAVLLAAEDAFAEGSINIDTSSAGSFSDVMESTKHQLTTLIEWAKLIPCFIGLHLDDQVRLLKCTWSELLMLRMATRYSPMEDTLVLGSGRALHREFTQDPEVRRLIGRILDEVVAPFKKMNIDQAEMACLKTIILFDADAVGLHNRARVEQLQDQAIASLETYSRQYYAQTPQRFPRMLLRLAALRSISRECLVYILQNRVQGEFRVDDFILEMIDSDASIVTPTSVSSPPTPEYSAPTPPQHSRYPVEQQGYPTDPHRGYPTDPLGGYSIDPLGGYTLDHHGNYPMDHGGFPMDQYGVNPVDTFMSPT